MNTPRPHDLLWLSESNALEGVSEEWVASQWRPALPVVVRRDVNHEGRIPVGVRGMRRDQRAAGWVNAAKIKRVVSPESLAARELLVKSPFVSMPPVQGAIQLALREWPWVWGITGSVGYALATEVPVLHADSDLDLIIRCPEPVEHKLLLEWQQVIGQLLCRADTQIETPQGAFALAEWLRDGRVLLKASSGPQLVSDPWMQKG
ncbi:malonate decarboxylase holo-ACP synthase [Buttiauxella gaviniae]|jgi:phosphoribosyl-dephospho-CoA transferase|uniref:Phosphoribosyl-dephospho-CoA transferase n=1 Tax=Buttiauxella gaviniae ATCC 51604 TaxID=1354253 RepID=A0A1B7HWV1_9ENTR|nr:malonate decarboxylase holo-ACP synthase [Buttiauxella gaviniae]MCT4708260.1 malonate decarboxylase holo-ACP synthase [Dryocola clanedunensis]OAT20141.1 phosphoribosyl-dephospho-CoA transferase [Buttiauxella gaviniae ATCC 51604]